MYSVVTWVRCFIIVLLLWRGESPEGSSLSFLHLSSCSDRKNPFRWLHPSTATVSGCPSRTRRKYCVARLESSRCGSSLWWEGSSVCRDGRNRMWIALGFRVSAGPDFKTRQRRGEKGVCPLNHPPLQGQRLWWSSVRCRRVVAVLCRSCSRGFTRTARTLPPSTFSALTAGLTSLAARWEWIIVFIRGGQGCCHRHGTLKKSPEDNNTHTNPPRDPLSRCLLPRRQLWRKSCASCRKTRPATSTKRSGTPASSPAVSAQQPPRVSGSREGEQRDGDVGRSATGSTC